MCLKTVDYRLFAIVISGLSLGIFYGIWAAVFASIGLIIQNILAGETNLKRSFLNQPIGFHISSILFLVW